MSVPELAISAPFELTLAQLPAIEVSFKPPVNDGSLLVPLNPILCRKIDPEISSEKQVTKGCRVQWGARLGDWLVESVSGATARVQAAAGWASGMGWVAAVDDLRAAA